MILRRYLFPSTASCLVFCMMALVPCHATADEDPGPAKPPSLRVHLAGGLGMYLSDTSQWPDGVRASPSCPPLSSEVCNLAPMLALGIDWSALDRFDVGLRGRWIHPFQVRDLLGRHLDVIEVLVVPRFNLPWDWPPWPRRRARLYLAAPLGVAWSIQYRSWTRAVNEEWNSRPGLSAGAAAGVEMYLGRRWGLLVELGYQMRFLSADVVSTPVDEPQSRVSERVVTAQQQLLLTLGVIFGLRR